jgi:hypothetical protein
MHGQGGLDNLTDCSIGSSNAVQGSAMAHNSPGATLKTDPDASYHISRNREIDKVLYPRFWRFRHRVPEHNIPLLHVLSKYEAVTAYDFFERSTFLFDIGAPPKRALSTLICISRKDTHTTFPASAETGLVAV